ncbi:MAG: hypothetical protein ABIS67_14585 [Candidatus Eisenbacteria bacterium]
MSSPSSGAAPLGAPPYSSLRAKLGGPLQSLRECGQPELAAGLELSLKEWWAEQSDWDARLVELLRLHHDINNALVGVSGNVQLMLRDPIAGESGVRERLAVMLREANRIHVAAARLSEIKSALQGGMDDARAA